MVIDVVPGVLLFKLIQAPVAMKIAVISKKLSIFPFFTALLF
jgi:hypothetical protein